MLKSRLISVARSSRGVTRSYHSVDHPTSNQIVNSKSVESKILTKALDYIPKFGFESICITQAIRDMGYADSLESSVTSNPIGTPEFQLMYHWLKVQRQNLEQLVVDPKSEFHQIRDEYDRVSYLIKKRLEFNVPIINKLGKGLGQLVVPYNINRGMEELHNLSDDISFYAGDRSNDFAWYSKRLSLSSVYVSSELFMLQDSSPEFKKTMEFVDNKVQGINDLGNAYNNVEQWGLFNAITLVNLIKSQLLRG
ncbi:COQ9-domain-containing protein [Suhomyces tanzawaensis NRRL Y-17324]|uniref:Ubiquinone biosynthesis protein n=1 Tax=Suhomyces tanzawaensis NRRL Y-17324 TaxID=984487 RepID=A0A1E4SJL1_9ASCO|nr:COQ9-domain-containing protein [Suhomyces tanzawaensis NRRL Y-17324]ODV79622.1 COQ9-domain-containing protein [Suhomyces tanzawaensis NRRL Y-17324]